MTDLVKAQQGVMVLLAVIGAGVTPPTPGPTAPRRSPIGTAIRLVTGRMH